MPDLKAPPPPEDPFDSIVDTPFDSALSERYLVYALSTITARSLPDLRDGLKPVHRRLLWAMRLLKLDPASAYKKSARVVGDVIGKYHPHGDQSVYDAMVRLAQNFALRYPLVDGQGNFGNVDGDNAAAYRYTEARLTASAMALMAGLDDGTVEYKPTYNGEDEEPEIFPGLFPNLLANGSSGIAVGMATSIPPHNVAEVIDAAMLLIERPEAEDAELLEHVKGPDLPTGGQIIDSAASIAEAYVTGRGAFRVRSRWHVEDLGRGTWVAVVTEIPYQVQKGKLIEAIAAIINDKKLPILADVRDESDEAIRIVIEPRTRAVDADVLMESLFKLSELEVRVSLNMNVLDADRTPRVLSLKDVLTRWIRHQIEVLVRRAQHRLGKIDDRIELLDGYLIAYLNLDEVIRIVRREDEPKPVLMKRFKLSDLQAEAILETKLRHLAKLEEMKIRGEQKELAEEQDLLEKTLKSAAKLTKLVRDELLADAAQYGDARRTKIVERAAAQAISEEELVTAEPVTVVLSTLGWVRQARGHDVDATALSYKTGDAFQAAAPGRSTQQAVFIDSTGRAYSLPAHTLPSARGPETARSPPKLTSTAAPPSADSSASTRSTAYSLPRPPRSSSMPAGSRNQGRCQLTCRQPT